MSPATRASLEALHTWAGVTLGALLFAICWTGTVCVFDVEADTWMMPTSRRPPATASIDRAAPHAARLAHEAGAQQWFGVLPTHRWPLVMVGYREASGRLRFVPADPESGALLPDPGTFGVSGFILPFHYTLHIKAWNIGVWIVGLAGAAMLALCLSGVLIHRRILVDLFVLRLGDGRRAKTAQRTVLDLHNVAGVIGLPFHIVIALSGLVIFSSLYFPGAPDAPYRGDRAAFAREAFGTTARTPKGESGPPPVSYDGLLRQATSIWDGAPASSVIVWFPGDAGSVVDVRKSNDPGIIRPIDVITFDAGTGAVVRDQRASPIVNMHRFIGGLHLVQFKHWTIRWAYFVLGLVGCAMIATGHLFWVESRRKRHIALGLRGVRLVEVLLIGSTAGLLAATASFLVANRALPADVPDRAGAEVWAFWLAWFAAFAHAWARPRSAAWAEQASVIAILSLLAVSLNALTTSDHLLRTLTHRHLWGVAGVDLVLLGAAFVAALAARALLRGPAPIGRVRAVAAE